MTERTLAKIICDSQPPEGSRLTTMEVVVPRIVLAEFNTHRVFSRNSASSRAIPIEKMLKRVLEDPYIPEVWTLNQKGMQGKKVDVDALMEDGYHPRNTWISARDAAVRHAQELLDAGIHKQTTNRLLEPFMWHTIIVTATEWSNFFHLRCHPDAHPAIRRTAEAMLKVYEESTPNKLEWNEWHLPFVRPKDWEEFAKGWMKAGNPTPEEMLKFVKVSSARCARVSYLTHDGVRDPELDLKLHDRLLSGGHMSPFEHPAQCEKGPMPNSNFAHPWVQYRKTIPNESDISALRGDA